MKKPKKVFLFLAAMILVLGITACDTGSSSDSTDDTEGTPTTPTTPTTPGDPAIPTIDQLIGTWEWQDTYTGSSYVDENTRTLTITRTSDTTASYVYSLISETDNVSSEDKVWYLEQEGNITLSADGTITKTIEREREAEEPFTDATGWDTLYDTGESYQAVIINSVLYFGPFKREGTGSGLVGTWLYSSMDWEGTYEEHSRTTLEITDTEMTMSIEESEDGVTYTLYRTRGPSSYTQAGNIITSDLYGTSGSFTCIQSDDWLILTSINTTSTTSFGWEKQ